MRQPVGDVGERAGSRQVSDPEGERLTFARWYTDWLDAAERATAPVATDA